MNSRKPTGFQPQNKYHRESVRFMRAEGIYALHNPDRQSREAYTLVVNLRVRPVVESLILGRMDAKEIALKVNQRYGEFFTAEGIKAYQHYYWNVYNLSVEEWSQLLADYDVQRQNTLAIIQVGPSLALHKTGFEQTLDSKTVLRDMMESVFFDQREWKTKPHGIERTKAFVALAKAAVILDAGLSASDGALKDALKSFEQFRMKHSAQKVQGLKDIAPDGNFSGSGTKLLDAPTEEVEGD